MSKTPIKELAINFVPREITTPNKDQPGLSKTVFSHVSSFHSLLIDWVKLKDKGSKFCKGISSVKLHEYNDDYYPHLLKPLTEGLVEIIDSFQNIIEGIKILKNQLESLSKLQSTDQPVILTWSVGRIHACVKNTYESLLKEYKLKKIVTENIAHCRDESLIEVYVSSWEFDPYLNMEENAYLFAEIGVAGIS